MAKYKKKPVVIDAWKWEGYTVGDARKFCESNNLPQFSIGGIKGLTGLIIPTLEGDHVAKSGDYIIKGINGECYPCKPDIFIKTYDVVED
jgi:hypothetical protein